MIAALTLYLFTGYAIAVIGIARGKDPYWQVRGSDALRLIAQEMVIWAPVLLLLWVFDVVSVFASEEEAAR